MNSIKAARRALLIASAGMLMAGVIAPTAGAKMTLRVRTWWTGLDQMWQKEIIEPYEKANPDIKIDYKAIPWSEYWQKQLLLLASGQVLGEVMLIDAKWTQDAIAYKFMLPLDSYIARDKSIKMDLFPKYALQEYRPGLAKSGPIYGLPLVTCTQPLFFNKSLFSNAGMTVPTDDWTWEDTFANAKRLSRDTNGDGKTDVYGMGLDGFAVNSSLVSYGGGLVDDKFSKSLVDMPQSIKAVSLWQGAIKQGGVTTDWNAFMKAKSAMQMMGDWNIAWDLKTTKVKVDWDVTVPPKGPAERAAMSWSNGFFIPPALPQAKRDAAWKFIKYVLTTPRKADLGLLFLGMMPAYKPLTMSPEYLDGAPKCNRKAIVEINEKYAFTHSYPKSIEWNDQTWQPELGNVWSGRKSPEQACRDAANKINILIQRWNKHRK